ncbi:MAG: DUF3800 domain-containing protein [Pseudomonadota bacterium]
MARRHYTIICDESDKKGQYFSNFFGGVLLKSQDRQAIEELLQAKKHELNLNSELKWQRVTDNYLDKYAEFIKFYFRFVVSNRIKVRIMFSQNIHQPNNLTKEQIENTYFRLYYQFIKHAFGIRFCNPNALDRVEFALLLDQIPDTEAKTSNFKKYLSNIPETIGLRGLGIAMPVSQVASVDSKDHVILQGLDIILGAMAFRLNDKHLVKPDGSRRRGKRTITKEKLYKLINREIRELYPGFNIGVSTGQPNGQTDRWHHQYRHWRFVPTNHTIHLDRGKRWTPPDPT